MLNSQTLGLTLLTSLLFIGNASAEGDTLSETDNVAISFWIATAMMLASTAFFLIERSSVAPKWRTSMTVAALVTGVAWYHYSYMREHWIITGESPLVLRYVDWLITVPLQVSEFYFQYHQCDFQVLPDQFLQEETHKLILKNYNFFY